MRAKWLIYTLLLCLAPTLALAQTTDCPDIVRQALGSADQFCKDLGRNQVCYGNVDMAAQPQPGITDFRFSQTGDIVDVASIQTLALSPMDAASGKWGVAVMKLQANLPDTLPGQNVTFLLFGDVQLASAVPDGSDLRPMQAFYLKTGVSDSQCDEAPESGMLVQTPQGVGQVSFNVNGVDVQMGSTVFFQADEEDGMTVSTLEGAAYVTAEDDTQVIVPGTWTHIPLENEVDPLDLQSGGGPAAPSAPADNQIAPPDIEDFTFGPAGKPEPPTSYEGRVEVLGSLPVDLLDEEIEIAPPLSETDTLILQELIQARLDAGLPLCGIDPLPDCDENGPLAEETPAVDLPVDGTPSEVGNASGEAPTLEAPVDPGNPGEGGEAPPGDGGGGDGG